VEMHPRRDTYAIMWIGDMAGGGAIRRCQVASADVAMWAHGLLTHPLASYALLFVHFCENSCIQIIFPSISGTT
jgi:hypothetical protein